MSEVRFYTDINIDRAVVRGLQQRGIDVVAGQDLIGNSASDPTHLALATEMGRVLISRDKDFPRIHKRRHEHHAGILHIVPDRSIGQIIEAAMLIHGVMTAEEMADAIQHW